MKHIFTFSLFIISLLGFSQTYDEAPVFEGAQRLTIKPLGTEQSLWWGFQNPEYTHIVDIISFTTESPESSIILLNEAIRVLEMPKPDKSGSLKHSVEGVSIKRYGFAPKSVYLHGDLRLNKRGCLQIIEALEEYDFPEPTSLPFEVGERVFFTRYNVDATIERIIGTGNARITFTAYGKEQTKTVSFRELEKKAD